MKEIDAKGLICPIMTKDISCPIFCQGESCMGWLFDSITEEGDYGRVKSIHHGHCEVICKTPPD